MIIECVDLSNWKKQKEILYELHREWGINITSRTWRIQVNKWNKKFTNGEVDYYIAHSNSKGFKATKDYKEAKIAVNDYLKRAYNMIKKAKDCERAFQQRKNYQIDFETGELK